MREDDLRRHAAEDEGHGEAEQHEVVLAEQRRRRRIQPCADADGVDHHRRPFEQERGYGKAFLVAGACHVENARGQVGEQERAHEDRNPDLPEGVVLEEWDRADEGGYRALPDVGTVVSR